MSNLSRRSLVTGAAALPALAIPAVAAAAVPGPDPIFAAIDHYIAAHAERCEACEDEPHNGSPEYAAWDEVTNATGEKEVVAARQFSLTVPTTIAGIAAALRFVKESNEKGDDFLTTFTNANEENPDEQCEVPFFASLVTAAENCAVAYSKGVRI